MRRHSRATGLSGLFCRAAFLGMAAVCSANPLEASSTGRLKAVRFAAHGDHKRVVLDLDRRVTYSLGQLSDPDRLYLDLVNTRAGAAMRHRSIAVDDALVRLIRVGQPRAGVTRVVLDLEEVVESNVHWLDDPPRLVVELRKSTTARGVPAPVPPASAIAAAGPPTAPSPSVPETTEHPPADAMPVPPAAPATPEPPAPLASSEAEGSGPTLRIPRVSVPPTLSDFLEGTARGAGTRVEEFFQRTPSDGVPVSQPTTAYVSYDDENLYAVFVCVEDPRLVRGHMARRESIAGDDRVSLHLDTFRDRRRAYVFSANALGIQQDVVTTEGQPDDASFDTVWHAHGRRTPTGYVVWMAIPFKSLRFADRPVQTWGIALGRTIPRNNETAYWPHITRRVQSFTAQLGTLMGIERVDPTRNVQVIPYGAFTSARLLGSGASYSTVEDLRGGADAKVVVRNALTFDATVRPDFSQVESDDPQVTINQRFEVFFPEKRPFFIENSGFFETPINLFFSRRVVDPGLGGRLTGKMGSWALGVLAADDRAAGRQLPPTDPLRDDRALVGAFRLQREVGRESTIGVLSTTRAFGSGLNQVVALDSRLKLGTNWSLTGQVARSYDRRPDGQRLDGTASYAQLVRGGEHFNYLGSYTDRSPGFRSQLGFIQRVDVRQADQHFGYAWQPQGKRLLSFGPSVTAGSNWNRQGQQQDWYATGDFAMDFAGPVGFTVSRYEAYELFLGTGFRYHTTGASIYTRQLRWLSISASYNQGTGINYSAPDPLPPFLGNETNGSATITLRPTPSLRLDQTYFFSRLATREGSTPPGVAESGVVFRNHLLRTRISYQFSKALSLRTILDYDDTDANPALIAESPFKRLRGDVLLTYLVQPGTAFYLGYTDRYDSVIVDPGSPPVLRMTGSPRTSTARQFFVKLSYLFRY